MKTTLFLIAFFIIFLGHVKVFSDEKSDSIVFDLATVDFNKENYYILMNRQKIQITLNQDQYFGKYTLEIESKENFINSNIIAINDFETNEIDFSNLSSKNVDLTIETSLNIREFLNFGSNYSLIVKFESLEENEIHYEDLGIDKHKEENDESDELEKVEEIHSNSESIVDNNSLEEINIENTDEEEISDYEDIFDYQELSAPYHIFQVL